jgi:flavodoxin
MKTLIVYDSLYGNTETIAEAVAKGITGDVKVIKVGNAKAADITDVNLLIIGSPTQGGRYTKTMEPFLNEITGCINDNIKIAVFDSTPRTFHGGNRQRPLAGRRFGQSDGVG